MAAPKCLFWVFIVANCDGGRRADHFKERISTLKFIAVLIAAIG